MSQGIKVAFQLKEEDLKYFRELQRAAQRRSKAHDPGETIAAARELIERVRGDSGRPRFIGQAADDLEELIEMIEDEDYALPQRVRARALGTLVYFTDPEDLIPDRIPGLGFLDDALMIRLAKEDLKHELGAYRKFKRFRAGAEARPWTAVAQARRGERLGQYRRRLRTEIESRQRAEAERGRHAIHW